MLKCAGLDVSDFFNDASKSIRLVEVCVMQNKLILTSRSAFDGN